MSRGRTVSPPRPSTPRLIYGPMPTTNGQQIPIGWLPSGGLFIFCYDDQHSIADNVMGMLAGAEQLRALGGTPIAYHPEATRCN